MKEFEEKITDKEQIMDIIFGRWRNRILYTGVELGIFDILKNTPTSIMDIAGKLELDMALSYRLLRALDSLEMVKESNDKIFSLTPAGMLLTKDHPETLREAVLLEGCIEHYALGKHLSDMIREGKQNAFVREFGYTAFDYADRNPAYAKLFDEAMNCHSRTQTVWALEALENYDFSDISHLCDIGGGRGHMLCSFLRKYPHIQGTLFERANFLNEEVLSSVKKMNLENRFDYVAGDMFYNVPAADAYIMKMMLHDWDDEECIRILSKCFESAPVKGHIFIVEYIVPPVGVRHFSKLFDIHMMCWGTGRERTEEEYSKMLGISGWLYVRTWFPKSKTMGVIEAIKPCR